MRKSESDEEKIKMMTTTMERETVKNMALVICRFIVLYCILFFFIFKGCSFRLSLDPKIAIQLNK